MLGRACIDCPNRAQAPGLGSIVAVDIEPHSAHQLVRRSVQLQSHLPSSSVYRCTAWQGMQYTGHPSRSWAPGQKRAREHCIALHIRHHGTHVRQPGLRLWSSDHPCKGRPGRQNSDHPNTRLQVATGTRSHRTWRGSASPGPPTRHVEAPSLHFTLKRCGRLSQDSHEVSIQGLFRWLVTAPRAPPRITHRHAPPAHALEADHPPAAH